MSRESTNSGGETGAPGELDERELLFNAYLDGELSEEREAQFDRRLENDPEFRRAYDEFAEIVGDVRNLPYEFAPDDFASKLQDRVRRRSRGGFFSNQLLYHQRAPYEVVAVVMFIVMASAYLFFIIPPDRRIESSQEKQLEVPPYSNSESPPDGAKEASDR